MSYKREYIFLVIIFALVAFFSTYKLTESPSVWYDEGMYIEASRNLSDGLGAHFQFAPGVIEPIATLTVGYPVIYTLALLFNVFGTDIVVARGMMVVWIFLLVSIGYALIRTRYSSRIALYSATLLATFPLLYGNGKSVLGEVPGLVFLTASLFSLKKAFSSKPVSLVWIILSGFFAGICAVTKPIFLVYLPAYAFVVLYGAYKQRIRKRDVFYGGIFSTLPVLVWIYVQFYASVSLHTTLTYYADPYGAGDLWGAILSNTKNFITEMGPLYLLLMLVVWIVAVGIRFRRKIRIPPEEVVALAFSLLIVCAYLRIVGWYRYLFPAQIIALLYFVPSLTVCSEWVREKTQHAWRTVHKISSYGVIVVTLLLSAYGAHGVLYNSWVADFYTSDKTAFWKNYFNELPEETSVFFYNTPEVAIFTPYRNYYQYLPLVAAGGPFGADGLTAIESGSVDVIIVRTDALKSESELFLLNYKPKEERYKYTILEKN